MSRRIILYSHLFIIVLIFLISHCGKKESVVARIGTNRTITLEAFKENFSASRPRKNLFDFSIEDLRSHLNKMVDDEVRIIDALEQGMDQDSTFQEKVEENRNQILMQMLYQNEIIEHFIPEREIRDYYARTGKAVLIRKIQFNVSPKTKNEDEKKIREKAEAVLERYRSGESFVTLMRQFSDDDKSKHMRKSGIIGPLTWTRGDDPIRRAAFHLKEGEVSELIQDKSGFSIIRVEEIQEKERQPYHEIQNNLRNQIQREKQAELTKYVQAYVDTLMKKNNVQWHEDNLKFIGETISSVPNKIKSEMIARIKALEEGDRHRNLVEYQNGQFNVEDFAGKLNTIPTRATYYLKSGDDIKRFVKNWILEKFLVSIAEKRGLHRDPEFKEKYQSGFDSELKKVVGQQVFDIPEPLEEDCIAYYEENKAEYFMEPDKVKIQEIMVRDSALAYDIVRRIHEGEDMAVLAKKHSKRFSTKTKGGITAPFAEGKFDEMGKVAFKLKIGEIAGPIYSEKKKEYSIIKLIEKVPSSIPSYPEIQHKVKEELKKELHEDAENAWREKNWSKYNVMIYDNVLIKVLEKK